jgi:hypothetical protein
MGTRILIFPVKKISQIILKQTKLCLLADALQKELVKTQKQCPKAIFGRQVLLKLPNIHYIIQI